MNFYLTAAATTTTKTVVTENLYNLEGGWSMGILGRQYKNKGMAVMQATNAARRAGKTLKVIG